MDQPNLTEIVGDIYEAPGNPSAWDRVTAQLASAFRSEFSQTIVFDTPDNIICNFVNIRAAGEEWARDYAGLDTAVRRVGSLRGPTPVTQFDLMSTDELRYCPVQQEFLPKHGVEHRIWIKGQPAPGLTQLAALIRSPRQGPFSADECRSFGILRRHLQRAMGLHIELAEARRMAATLELGLDRLQTAVVLLDGTGSVVFANVAARAILDAKDGIWLDHGTLAATTSSANRALQSLVARSLGRVGMAVGGGLAIARGQFRPLVIRAVPLRLPTDVIPPGPAVAVLLTDPERPVKSDDVALAALGLTVAEGRLVAALMTGANLEQYAQQTNLSLHTVRTVLKSIFGKTGTHRQSELIALAMRNSLGG